MTLMNVAMTTLLNGICLGAILAATMRGILRFFPRWNSATRFTVLWMTLLAVVALLAAPLARRPPVAQPPVQSLAVFPASPAMTAAPMRISLPGPDAPAPQPEAAAPEGFASTLEPGASPDSSTRASTGEPRSAYSLIRLRSTRFLRILAMVWVGFSFVLLTRLAVGYAVIRRLKTSATPASPDSQLRLHRLCSNHGVGRRPRLLVSSRVNGPMSLGFFRPVIVIPPSLLETLSHSELQQIVLHELAHLHRRDDWSNLAQKLIEALFPIQPAIYWLGRQLSLEREMACDDWVIAATGTPGPYADALTKVAEFSQWQRTGILAAGASGNRSQLFRRVRQILDHTRNTAPRLAMVPLSAALAVVVGLTCLSARVPRLIAFAQGEAVANPVAEPLAPQPPSAPAPVTPSPAPRTPRMAVAPAAAASPIAPVAPAVPPAAQVELSPMSPPSPLSPPSPASPLSPMSPTSPMAPATPPQSDDSRVQIAARDGWTIRTRNGWTSLDLKMDGTVEFSDDDSDVKSLSPNGRFRLEEGGLLSKRSYEVTADGAGRLTRSYSEGWSNKPVNDEVRAWLARTLPQIIRDSGIGAGARVGRILHQGGAGAVLAEIGRIHSDGARRVYLEQLFSQATLNPSELKDAAGVIRGISSDGDKAHVLIVVDRKYFASELRPNLFEAVDSIHSDGDKRQVLSDILSNDGENLETLVRAARSARQISSDGDKAEVLLEMAGPYRPAGGVNMAYFEAANSISSDGDRARVLSRMLSSHGSDNDAVTRVLASAQRISSDGDKARVLKEAVAFYREDASVRKAFFDAANSISSDGDHQQVLVSLAEKPAISSESAAALADSARRISSDGDKARVLIELIGANVEPGGDALFMAANSIHSDGDRSRVLMAVLDKPGISSATAVAAVQSATSISSDGDKARVLLDAAERYSGDPAVNGALRKAVEGLHSDGDYRTVMSHIRPHEASL